MLKLTIKKEEFSSQRKWKVDWIRIQSTWHLPWIKFFIGVLKIADSTDQTGSVIQQNMRCEWGQRRPADQAEIASSFWNREPAINEDQNCSESFLDVIASTSSRTDRKATTKLEDQCMDEGSPNSFPHHRLFCCRRRRLLSQDCCRHWAQMADWQGKRFRPVRVIPK